MKLSEFIDSLVALKSALTECADPEVFVTAPECSALEEASAIAAFRGEVGNWGLTKQDLSSLGYSSRFNINMRCVVIAGKPYDHYNGAS